MAQYTFLGLQATAWTGIQAILTGIGLIAVFLLFWQMKIAIKTIQHDSYNRLNDDFQRYITASAENPHLRISDLEDLQVDIYQKKYNIKDKKNAIGVALLRDTLQSLGARLP